MIDQALSQPSKRRRHNVDLYQLFGNPSDDQEANFANSSSTRSCVEREIEAYRIMKVTCVECYLDFDVLGWWNANGYKLPILTRFARFVHAIPASSIPSERCFSTAGNIYTEKRNRLKPKTLNSMMTLKSNWDIMKSTVASLVDNINTNSV